MYRADSKQAAPLASGSPIHTSCHICTADLTAKSHQEKQEHYDEHCLDGSQASKLDSFNNKPSTTRVKDWFKPYVPNKGDPNTQNIFWYPAQSEPPPRNFSPGLIPVVKRALIQSHENGRTQRAWLCHEQAVHIVSEAFDRSWGCGYRNFMMACASLMSQTKEPMYFPLLDHPVPPGVRYLQSWVEEAWRKGFDDEGATQLKRRLVGTGKFIGTGELYVAFTYRGIPAQLLDIDLKNGVHVLLNWVLQHFSADDSSPRTMNEALSGVNSVVVTGKMPLILQHDGHSRTIVGCERCVDGTISLLVFDPAKHIPQDLRELGLASHAATCAKAVAQIYRSSTSRALHEVPQAVQIINSHKRKSVDISQMEAAKRPRQHSVTDRASKESSHDNERNMPKGPAGADPSKILNIVRIGESKLRWKRRYQILYFPLTAPLDDAERWARRELTAIQIG